MLRVFGDDGPVFGVPVVVDAGPVGDGVERSVLSGERAPTYLNRVLGAVVLDHGFGVR